MSTASGPTWEITGDDTSVTAWSMTRLPFEPRGELLDYRAALRRALRALASRPGAGLLATYAAPDAGFVDVENVALYNVGAGSYSHLTADGIDCRRTRSIDSRHRLTYRVAALPAYETNPEAALATIDAAVPQPAHTAGQWWTPMRPRVRAASGDLDYLEQFTVEVELAGRWPGTTLAATVKPLLDGLVSALHAHDGTHAAELAPALAALGDPSTVWAALRDSSAAILGTRTLVRPHAGRIAWNPADDRCQAFQVRTRPAADRRVKATVRRAPTQG